MDWVVWDKSYLDQFYSIIKGAIGSSTNVGIIIFGSITALFVIRIVVKRFARG